MRWVARWTAFASVLLLVMMVPTATATGVKDMVFRAIPEDLMGEPYQQLNQTYNQTYDEYSDFFLFDVINPQTLNNRTLYDQWIWVDAQYREARSLSLSTLQEYACVPVPPPSIIYDFYCRPESAMGPPSPGGMSVTLRFDPGTNEPVGILLNPLGSNLP